MAFVSIKVVTEQKKIQYIVKWQVLFLSIDILIVKYADLNPLTKLLLIYSIIDFDHLEYFLDK